MKIVAIRGQHVEYRLPQPVRNAVSLFDKRQALVVQVIAEDGSHGWGECTHLPATVWSYIAEALAPRLIGQDARQTGRLWRAMMAPRASGDISMMAVSALDMALWDLRGRIEGRPVSDLLGGALRSRIASYASGPFMQASGDPYGDFLPQVARYLEQGYSAVKIRAGASPRQDGAVALALRREFGPDLVLMADMNRGYSRPAAAEAMAQMAPAEPLWIEEPLAPDDFEGYRLLAARGGPGLAAGEALARIEQFRDFLALGAVTVIQPDLYLCGGFTGMMRIAALAEAHSVPLVPHVWGTAVNFHASLQLCAVLPAARLGDGALLPMFEWDQSDNALLRVAGLPAIAADRTLAIPDGPGIGVDLSAESFAPFSRQRWQIGTPGPGFVE